MFLGRPVGPAEPQWLDEDRDKVRALIEVQAEECPQCGTRHTDWLDGDGYELDEPAWMVEFERCVGCQEIERAHGWLAEQKRKGVKVRFVPFTDDDEDEEG